MLETIRNAWKTPELRKRILFTAVCLLIFCFGTVIPVPFINKEALSGVMKQYENTILGFFNMMSGGGFEQANLFALSIQPYINASIIMQLLSVAIPALERLSKEGGEEGRKKIATITRYVTVVIALLQGFAYFSILRSGGALVSTDIWATLVIIITFTAGSAFIMWLGEQITSNGIGNGISIILFASIISRIPQLIGTVSQYVMMGTWNFLLVIGLVVGLVALIGFIVFVTDAERRIPVSYAKRMVGRKMYGGRSTNLPIKVNMSGVMPIIFASSIATFPATIAAFFPQPAVGSFWYFVQNNIFSPQSATYAVIYLILIVLFSYFYAAIQFNPVEIANNLKNNGGFVPGFRPGRPTSDFIGKVMNKVTLFGAVFLGIIAVIPILVGAFVPGGQGLAIGGTSLLIVVGVAQETVKQLESQLMMRNYKGFLE